MYRQDEREPRPGIGVAGQEQHVVERDVLGRAGQSRPGRGCCEEGVYVEAYLGVDERLGAPYYIHEDENFGSLLICKTFKRFCFTWPVLQLARRLPEALGTEEDDRKSV